MRVYGRDAFAAQRKGDQDEMEKVLFPYVAQAVKKWPADDWYNELLAEVGRQYLSTFHTEGGKGEPKPSAADFLADVRTTLDKTENPTPATTDRISVWLSTAILNAGTQAAAATDEEFLVMEWVTMHDDAVREMHREADGQTRPPDEPFDVCDAKMRYPGDPTGPIECWMNCRCALAPVLGSEAKRFTEGDTMTATVAQPETQPTEAQPTAESPSTGVPWHGVLAPEDKWSGDGRRFLPNSLTHRDLPMPLAWQKFTEAGHDGGMTVAKIEKIDRVDGEMRASGHFLQIPEADEVVGLLGEFGKFGISVDADDAEYTFDDDEGHRHSYSAARICAAAIVAIPAFAEAYIQLGDWPDSDFSPTEVAAMEPDGDEECDPTDPNGECYDPTANAPGYSESSAQADTTEAFVSDKPWSDFTQSDYTPDQWKQACCMHLGDACPPMSDHKLPIKEPGGALNRNGVHAAAARFNQVDGPPEAKAAAKSKLRGAYSQIGEEPPDVLKATAEEAEEFGRGPGWITDPVPTKRIHDYWTKPGQEGFVKVGWGTPGDFNRCRVEVGEEIAENSPDKVRFLNQICAQWHYDALGYWPGRPTSGEVETFGADPAPAVSMVASAAGERPPLEWFTDPLLTTPTPLTVTEEGRVFGHIAAWGTCHVGYGDTCEEPPPSPSNYAYFRTGEVITASGPVAVGCLTIGGGHAGGRLGSRPALAHYDDVATAWADVAAGEDEVGIWVAGYVRPGTTPEMVVAARASKPSGDWRRIGGALEMIAVHQVNTQGFVMPRVTISDGVQVALVAAGMLPDPEPMVRTVPDAQDWADILSVAFTEMAERKKKMTLLKARVHGEREK